MNTLILVTIFYVFIFQMAQDLSAHPQTPVEFHDTLTTIEQLYEQGQYSGPVERFFKIIEMCASKRPVSSLLLSSNAFTLSLVLLYFLT